jgi:hypothetical protein
MAPFIGARGLRYFAQKQGEKAKGGLAGVGKRVVSPARGAGGEPARLTRDMPCMPGRELPQPAGSGVMQPRGRGLGRHGLAGTQTSMQVEVPRGARARQVLALECGVATLPSPIV